MKKENKQLKWIMVWLVLLPLCLAAKAQGASFDCSKATTKIEKMICADAELSKLDEQLDTAYKTALQDKKQADAVRQAQKQWLKERNGCADADCVKLAYESRLQKLSSSATMPEPSDGKTPAKESSATQPAKKQLYGHCVDVGLSGSCGEGQTGKGYTVCENYLNYLNSLQDTPKCEVPIPPGFTEPEWEEVDFMQHLDWAYQIAKNKFVGTHNLTFEEWKPLFLKNVADGLIAPQMCKTQIKPLGGKPITLLAFTEDKDGCKRPQDPKEKPYAVWHGLGYLYFLLADGSASRLIEIGGEYSVSDGQESVLLIYADKPYFVTLWEWYASPFESVLDILAFDHSQWRTIPERNMYSTMRLCRFSPVNQYKPKKIN